LDVRAVEITGSNTADAPMPPDRLTQIPGDHKIGRVTADGAFDTLRCHNSIADRGAAAIIPPRRNAQPWTPSTAGLMARNDAFRASKHLGRAPWRNLSGDHRRSRVETKMHCVKLLGQRLMARDFDRQVTDVQVRIAVLNGDATPCIPTTDSRQMNALGERGDPSDRRFVQLSLPRRPQIVRLQRPARTS
jgi:hypothetical protein